MKILIVLGYGFEEQTILNRFDPLINSFLKKGYSVKTLSPGNKKLELTNSKFEQISMNFKLNKAQSFLGRAFNEIYVIRKLILEIRKHQSNLTILSAPSMFLLFLSKKFKSKSILDLRDITWDYLFSSNKIYRKVIGFFFTKIAKIKLRNFNYYSCSNAFEASYLINFMKIEKKKIFIYSNGISSNHLSKLKKISKNKNINNNITYAGNVGHAQELTTLIKAAAELPNFKFNIVGNGPKLNNLKRLTIDLKISNVFFLNKVQPEDLFKIYEKSLILYGQIANEYRTAIPSKLYEYLATGKKVIFAGPSNLNEFTKKFENVYFIEPCNYLLLKNTIENISKKNQLNDTFFRKKNYKELMNFNREINSTKFIKWIKLNAGI